MALREDNHATFLANSLLPALGARRTGMAQKGRAWAAGSAVPRCRNTLPGWASNWKTWKLSISRSEPTQGTAARRDALCLPLPRAIALCVQMFGGSQGPDRENLARATARYWMQHPTRHGSFLDVSASQVCRRRGLGAQHLRSRCYIQQALCAS